MRIRRGYLPLAAALGFAVAVLPSIASSEPLPVEAVNEGLYFHHWSNAQQTVIGGEKVKFSNSSSTVPHGLKFTGGTAGMTPSCTGIPTAATTETGAYSWHGECTFSTPGTYTFICTVHPSEMTGTITVNANGTTTTTTPMTTTTTTTTPTTPVEPPSGSPLVGGPSLRSSQHGGSVKGSLDISKAGAGDRLKIDVFAMSASLAKTKHPSRVRVGQLIRGSVSAGRMPFVVRLNARARRALKHHRRLALTVRITLTPSHGKRFSVTRAVVEHA